MLIKIHNSKPCIWIQSLQEIELFASIELLSSYIKGFLVYVPVSTLKVFPWKNFLYFFLSFFLKKPALKKFLLFFPKRSFFLFREMKLSSSLGNVTFWPQPQNFLYFFLKELALKEFLIFCYILGNGTFWPQD